MIVGFIMNQIIPFCIYDFFIIYGQSLKVWLEKKKSKHTYILGHREYQIISKFYITFYSDIIDGDQPILDKKTYIAFKILKIEIHQNRLLLEII